ncbi:MAG: protein-disulfide reductase DsbD domain-containing protein [Ferruginibacter sp.]
MKKTLLLPFLVFAVVGSTFAQIENPVQWTYSAKKIADKTFELHMTALIDGKWHMYAQDAGEGPEPTAFAFTANPLVKLDGKVREDGKLEKSYDPNFKSTLKYYGHKVDFIQKVKLKSSASTVIKGTVTYMTCDDKKCLPPKEIPFSIKLEGK